MLTKSNKIVLKKKIKQTMLCIITQTESTKRESDNYETEASCEPARLLERFLYGWSH